MKKLIPLIDFVLSRGFLEPLYNSVQIRSYAHFLAGYYDLKMFVPCKLVDGVWVFLKEPKSKGNLPKFKKDSFDYNGYWDKQNKEYKEAKDHVLFRGFEYIEILDDPYSKFKITDGCITIFEAGLKNRATVESLIPKGNIELTENAKKLIDVK